MYALLFVFLFSVSTTAALAQSETVVEIASRGQKIRAILITPNSPVGSVVLLAGGHGKLDISAEGRIGWGAGNQLVRTRAAYANAGYATLVPDIAPDLKTPGGVVDGYRYSARHGQDIGALVQYMRGIKAPVVLVGTSRGAVSAGAAVAHSSGPKRPDALVLTAPMLVPIGDNKPNFQMAAGDPARARLPFLVVGHKKDTCRWTASSTFDRFKQWQGGKVEVTMLDGPPGSGDPCEAQSAHGFFGIDENVVSTVTQWVKGQGLIAQ
jgi:dienelactone hydrolase